MKRTALIWLTMAFFAVLPPTASAASLQAGEDYSLAAGQKITGDLYVGAGNVNIAGDVEGDLLIGGGNVVVTGNIGQDLIVGGGSVKVLGTIGDDLRIGGGDITVGSKVIGDLVVAGGNVQILPNSSVGGDVVSGSGALLVDGIVAGNIQAAAGDLTINGSIGGGVVARAEKIKLGSTAKIAGPLKYQSPREVIMAPGSSVAGPVDYEKIKGGENDKAALVKKIGAAIGLFWFAKLVMILIGALILVWLMPNAVANTIRNIINNFGWEAGRGFVVLVVTPVAAIISLMTLIGAVVGIVVGVSFILVIVLAKILTSLLLGTLIFQLFKRTEIVTVGWREAVVGVVGLGILGLIPVIGWIAAFIFFLATLGGLTVSLYRTAQAWR